MPLRGLAHCNGPGTFSLNLPTVKFKTLKRGMWGEQNFEVKNITSVMVLSKVTIQTRDTGFQVK
jgi:hypothetical protein